MKAYSLTGFLKAYCIRSEALSVTIAIVAPWSCMLSGCTLPDNNVDRLPDPATPLCPPPVVRNDAEQARLDERDQFLYDDYVSRWGEGAIVVTNQTPQCSIVDCILLDRIDEPWVEPPPPLSPDELVPPDGMQLQLTELDVHPKLQCPANSMAVDRPSFSGYVWGDTGATSLQDWLDNDPEVVGAPPSDTNIRRLYAGIVTLAENTGVKAWINSFDGELEKGTMSILEIAVGCPDPITGELLQMVGFAVGKDWANVDSQGNYGDTAVRLKVEFLTNGDKVTGPKRGGWDGLRSRNDLKFKGWRPYGPGVTIDPSTISTVGGPQFAGLFEIQRRDDGSWWIGHNGNWLAYYESPLFGNGTDNLLATTACRVLIYGEVADRREEVTSQTSTDMVSPKFAEAGFGNAAGFVAPYYRDPSTGLYRLPNDPPDKLRYIEPPQYNPNCYSHSQLAPGLPPTYVYLYTSGPGFGPDAPNCQ